MRLGNAAVDPRISGGCVHPHSTSSPAAISIAWVLALTKGASVGFQVAISQRAVNCATEYSGECSMFFLKRRILVSVAALSAVALAGCSPTQDGDPSPPPQPATFKALYSLTGFPAIPWPNDLFFNDTKDGTIDLTGKLAGLGDKPYTALGPMLNALDGFSTTAPMDTSFDNAIDGASLSGTTVHLIEMYLSNTTKLPAGAAELPQGVTSPISRVLKYGTDFTAEVSSDYDSFGKILRITPLKPLRPSTGATNIGYYVLLTNGIRDVRGQGSVPDDFYASLKAAPANCSSFTTQPNLILCAWTKAHLSIAQAVGIDPASVVVSWNFTTQSVDDVMAVAAQLAPEPTQAISVAPTGFTTADVLPGYPGNASIYVGRTTLPYYLGIPASRNDPAFLNRPWLAAGPPLVPGMDPTSRHLTRFNPIPGKTADVTVPLLVTVPNDTAGKPAGCTKPAAGWPVVIFQHGYPRSRTDSLFIADALANGCFVMAAIDAPLHGITDSNSKLYDEAYERTFNVDLLNNDTGASGPDGKIDPTGSWFINLNFLVTRDNLRQASADVIALSKSVKNLDVTSDGQPDIDPNRVHLVTLSFGGIASMAAVKFSPEFRSATIADSGGVITRLVRESPQQYPAIRAKLEALGVAENSTIYNNVLMRDAQTVIDSGDPINFVRGAQLRVPMIMSKIIGDTNVPNSAFDRLVLAGGFTQASAAGATAVGPGTGRFVAVTEGGHGSILYPPYSLAATKELQTEAVLFAATVDLPAGAPCPPVGSPCPAPGGPYLVISNTSIIQ